MEKNKQMNRMMKIALGAVMVGFALPVFAQDNFPDVPDNHWAYEAMAAMKKAGCLVGYPDGLVRGGRPMSRYEFACAAYACWQKMMSMHDDLVKQIEEMKGMSNGGDLKKQLSDMQAQIDGMKSWGNRINDLDRMTKEFEKELASMGVDVKKLRQDLSDLEGRVSELEKHKPAVDIHGTADFLMLAAHSTDKHFGVTRDGRWLGQNHGTGGIAGLTTDLTMLHELAFQVSGTNTEGPKWEATIVEGNMFGGVGGKGLGAFSAPGGDGFNNGPSNLYVNTASVTFDSSLVGQGFNAKLGRVGYQVGPYIWKRTDFNNYFSNERWDNGDWYFDGGILGFNFGKASLKLFGGTNSSVTVNNAGGELNPQVIGGKFSNGNTLDRTLGVNLEFPVGEMGNINLAYLWQDVDGNGGAVAGNAYNRQNTLGAQIDLKFEKIGIWGSFAQTNLSRNTSNVMDDKNKAWDLRGSYDGGNWGAGLGYREVEQNFTANGSWGRLGTYWSPVNIKGFNANVWFKPGQNGMKIWAKGEFDKPKDSTVVGDSMANYDRVDMFKVGLDYPLGTNWNAMLSYEDTKWKGKAGAGDDKERWFTLGVNYGLGANANIMFTYQFSDNVYNNATSQFNPNAAIDKKWRGGLFGTQLSVKF